MARAVLPYKSQKDGKFPAKSVGTDHAEQGKLKFTTRMEGSTRGVLSRGAYVIERGTCLEAESVLVNHVGQKVFSLFSVQSSN